MIIRRKHTGNFAVIPNSTTHDRRLSAEALGVLVYLLTKPSDWLVNMAELRQRFDMGRDRLYNIMAELEACGYVVRSQNRADASKRFCPVEYIVHDVPVAGRPQSRFLKIRKRKNPNKRPLPCLPHPAQPYPENQDA